ncbi:MAG: hypothetical protein JWN03_398 [Nocardia sp.]|uniref:hypothetical protein n=1 Tax=Nocardia sp. TaxID=1821 RepID=UPI00260A7148|nr:hypothetical protein [Nocardia sp.]MCU1640123.1 hypothetical protein [Nocardia sp.]
MRFKKFAATSALAIAALGVSAGTSYADTAPAPAAATAIHYDTKIEGSSVVLKTDIGSLTTDDGQLQVRDPQGGVVTTVPLSFVKDGQAFPIAAQIDGNTATLTPNADPAAAQPVAPGTPLIKQVDATANPNFNQALSNLSSTVSVGVAIGSLVGTVIGAGIGCIAGGAAVALGATVISIGTLTIPGFLGGCLVTGAAMAAIGLVAGTIIIGGPVVAVGLFQFFSDLATPPAPAAPAS